MITYFFKCQLAWLFTLVCYSVLESCSAKPTVKLQSRLNSMYLDINECDMNNGGCQHNCTDDDPGYICSCDDGYFLLADNHSCDGNLLFCHITSLALLGLESYYLPPVFEKPREVLFWCPSPSLSSLLMFCLMSWLLLKLAFWNLICAIYAKTILLKCL